jgi:hypothetical protein
LAGKQDRVVYWATRVAQRGGERKRVSERCERLEEPDEEEEMVDRNGVRFDPQLGCSHSET